ncbi:M56 family metallopeptidase [Pedobacter boryungensis]|uniref:M56 family metallopeptidase n=1 Tax=Pedobacter boryungensis TaxID=869962 RepID=A0ABX2DB51_9SPHI|nr:M56 family metallopeptidase [Pedobacter boryungensis]NQX31274.1 M56 family metallopeptidase [Pedobacter boryungensis]
MDWLYYLLEANLYLLIFYGFYRLFLQNETFYNSNRYYLLLSSATAFILPVLQLGFLKPTPIVDNLIFPAPIVYEGASSSSISASSAVVENFNFMDYLYPIYLGIVLCFAFKLALSLSKIIKIWLKAKKAKTGNVTLIELKDQTTAFSFFNLLFIHPHLAEKETVLHHEMVHIKQKHSLDILFFEVLQIICWFNPIIYFIKKDIKLLHEYIADELSTNSGLHKHEYAMFLIENSFGVTPTPLTNQIFNQSILKRRINMLNKKRTAGWARLRLLMALPLVGAMLCASTMAFTKDYGYVDLLPEKSKTVAPIQETPVVKKDQVKFPPPVVMLDSKDKFYVRYGKDEKTGKTVIREKRYILINGKAVKDLTTFYGVYDADNVKYFAKKDAIAKYGVIAQYGAVEITGKDIKYFNQMTLQPPPPVQDRIKFPPPMAKLGKTYFYPIRHVDKGGEIKYSDRRYIVINGKKVEDLDTFFGVTNATKIVSLNGPEARKKYGSDANYGAVEISGNNLKYVKSITDGPPPPKMDQIKFPPPIVKPDRKNLKRPPAVEPPPPGYRPKQDQIKFPPPVVMPDNQTSFHPRNAYRQDGEKYIPVEIDKRYIVINGEAVNDKSKFYGVSNTESITFLSAIQAMKVYGNENGKNGAVEIKGANIKYIEELAPPPPKQDQIKFPPPIVKPNPKKH